MRFGSREICDVVFKAKSDVKIGQSTFKKGQPVLYIDSATASTVEGAATTVYAQGGKGYSRLIAWEGEKTLTFTVTDALLSPIGFAILSGAGLFKGKTDAAAKAVHVHKSATTTVESSEDKLIVDLTEACEGNKICKTAPIFVVAAESDGSVTGVLYTVKEVSTDGFKLTIDTAKEVKPAAGQQVFVDFYITMGASKISELQIEAGTFAGSYYVEASTLFRRQSDGVDMPVEITFPNVKLQSNFTFSMAPTGDPSTFDFTMDAFPGYTNFDNKKKVLCVMQIVEDVTVSDVDIDTVMGHIDTEADANNNDSYTQASV